MSRAPRSLTMQLRHGDVRAIRVFPGRRRTRLVVYQPLDTYPLVQALLSDEERTALARALLPSRRAG